MIKLPDTLHLYVLDNWEPVRVFDFEKWASFWLKNEHAKIVAQDEIKDSFVSTIFLTMDCNHGTSKEPALFETRVFDGPFSGYTKRCSTWTQAQKNHSACVYMVNKANRT